MPEIRFFVGVTDNDWYRTLKDSKCDEVNFWKPSAGSFRALSENELFLFKLKSPANYIAGGGFFVRYSILPTFLAWEAFGIKNGTHSIDELNHSIEKYRHLSIRESPEIGCIILTEPFFFEESEWIPTPKDWSAQIVTGKTYTTGTSIGASLYSAVQERLTAKRLLAVEKEDARYASSLTKHRLGQGAFRVAVTEAYSRRCAISGEKTLPVLQAAHIQPYAEDGPHLVQNGLLLRSDIHTLFDSGYITVTPEMKVEVSPRLHQDYGNGKDYYKHHGQSLLILPEMMESRPGQNFLIWHNEHVYRG